MLWKTTATFLCAAAIAALAPAAQAEVYFSEDFESYTITGDPVVDQPSNTFDSAVGTKTRPAFSDLNMHVATSTVMPTQVLSYVDVSGNNLDYRTKTLIAFNGDTGFHASFDASVNGVLADNNYMSVALSTRIKVSEYDLAVVRLLGQWTDANEDTVVEASEMSVTATAMTDNGTLYAGIAEGLAFAQSHHVDMYVNQHDTDTMTYLGPDGNMHTVYSNSYDAWVDGIKGGGRNPSGTADDLNYRSYPNYSAGDSQDLYLYIGGSNIESTDYSVNVDNILVDSIPVPEPATLSLVGLGALAMIRRRR